MFSLSADLPIVRSPEDQLFLTPEPRIGAIVRRMTWPALCLIGALLASQATPAETSRSPELPIPVSLCELSRHGGTYDRKLVEVSGRVWFGKFNFDMDADCGLNTEARVWLDLGGDVESPHGYWGVGPVLPKQTGRDVEVRSVKIPLVHDALLDRFVNDVGAMRFQKPNGDGCGSDCLFYDVTATLRGRFFSGTKGGFGMDECCDLLVIEQVTSITSKRRSVPAGGEFQCQSDRWRPTPEEWKTFSKIPACSLAGDFNYCYAALAKHWGDTIKPSEGGESDRYWISRDMTRSYKFEGGFAQKPGQATEITPLSSVTRTVCHATSPPAPASDHVECKFYRTLEPEDKGAAMALQEAVKAGHESWRTSDMAKVGWLAYGTAIRELKLASPGPVKLAECEGNPVPDVGGGKQEYGYCTWFSSDGFREVTVEMHKPAYLTKSEGQFDEVPWIATFVEVNLCRTAPEPH